MFSSASGGELITFYSFKGGTGRTMALANVAYLLAQRRSPGGVLMVDWDLEAPGLHRYFPARTPEYGLIDLVEELRGRIPAAEFAVHEETALNLVRSIDLARYVTPTGVDGLSMISAGRFDHRYAARVNVFDWEALHESCPYLIRALGGLLANQFRYVLVDSRTGFTDTAGICTSILPDKLVVVFTPNRQSLFGATDIVKQAAQYRRNSDDLRPLLVYPMPARVESSEPELRDAWRLGRGEIPGYQPLFEGLFAEIYALDQCDLSDYFAEIQIQHVPRFAYGEEIAARVEAGDRLSLARSYGAFAQRLIESSPPGLNRVVDTPEPDPTSAWFGRHRVSASRNAPTGYMEATLRAAGAVLAFDPRRLLSAAGRAEVSGVGWPIGAVVSPVSEGRPRPSESGIEAEIVDSRSWDTWALRSDGSFYFARALEEDGERVVADERIERILELLLYAERLYTFLGFPPWVTIHIDVRLGGLKGRTLWRKLPFEPDGLAPLSASVVDGDIVSNVAVELSAVSSRLKPLTMELCRPLFLRFRVFEWTEPEYEHLLRDCLARWGLGG